MNRVTSSPALSRRLIAGAIAAVAVTSQFGARPAQATLPQVGAGVTFAAKLPLVHEGLPLYRLTATGAPTALVQGVLQSMKSTPLAMVKSLYVSRNERGLLKAFVDPVRGDAEVFPDLSAVPTRSVFMSRASLHIAATNVFARTEMIPKDATTVRLGSETPVFSSAQARPGAASTAALNAAPQKLFTYVTAVRYAHGLPVFGKGSQATVAVGEDGSIRGLVRRWQAAAPAGTVAPSTTGAQLVDSIQTQLRQFQNAQTQITVNSITTAYYDGGAKFIQPVYAFLATVHGGKIADEHVVGFVPVGTLVEPIPNLNIARGPSPVSSRTSPLAGLRPQANGTYITLGEYANRDGTMLDMANAYANGYANTSPWWAPAIVRTQWYWAYPGDYVGSSNSYVNSVNIAVTQPHGDWWENTTNGRGDGFFYINDIGTNGNPGYGAAAGGVLSTWIIDSCEVLPSFYDLSVTTGNGYNAFTPWWPVFQGLHRAIGFRTQMLLGMDDMNYKIATDQAAGADAISAFFSEIGAVDFNSLFGTYYNSHLGFNVNWDRGSAFFDSRNAGESIYATYGQSAAGNLNNVWMGN